MKDMEKIMIQDNKTMLAPEMLTDIRDLISESRNSVTQLVNSALTCLYWKIGNRINTEILKGERADYGKQIVATLSRQLVKEFGNSFTEKNLRRMVQFSEIFSEFEIVVTLSRQFSWSHFVELIPIEDKLKREFYIEMCRMERWSVRKLRNRIDSMLYERTAISGKPEELIEIEIKNIRESGIVEPSMVLKDPYILDFLGVKDHYIEKDLEDAILRELELFLLELGAGFSFIERQKRITIDNDDFYIDLLFYNRKLKRLIAIDLKIGDFKAAYKGQMELYLRWLDKYERQEGEDSPLGIIMCAGKKSEQIELLELDKTGIHIAEYLTLLPDKEIIKKKLQYSIEVSRKKYEQNKLDE